MKPGKRGPNYEENPSVCHKTPPQWPESGTLVGFVTVHDAEFLGKKYCRSKLFIYKNPFKKSFQWIGGCSWGSTQGIVDMTDEWFFTYYQWSRTTTYWPYCVEHVAKQETGNENPEYMTKVRWKLKCVKANMDVDVEISGVKYVGP